IGAEEGEAAGNRLRDARLERQELNIIAAIQLDLRGFLAGDHAAYFGACGLDGDHSGLYLNGLSGLANRELNGDFRLAADVDVDASQDKLFEARYGCRDAIDAYRNIENNIIAVGI